MKNLLNILVISFLWCACGNDKPEMKSLQPEAQKPLPKPKKINEDSLKKADRLRQIDDSITLLKQNFCFGQARFYKAVKNGQDKIANSHSYPVYSHRNWWCRYIIASSTVTGALDSAGNLVMFSMHEGGDCLGHYAIRFVIDGKKYETRKADKSPLFLNDWIRATCWEVNNYSEEEKIFGEIAVNTDKKITVQFAGKYGNEKFVAGRSLKNAFRDCYLLSRLLKLKTKL